jgi:starch synthase (maltosyl-transferring)
VHVPLELIGAGEDETYQVHDLLTDRRYFWTGSKNYVHLHPGETAVHIFRVLRKMFREQDFENYT